MSLPENGLTWSTGDPGEHRFMRPQEDRNGFIRRGTTAINFSNLILHLRVYFRKNLDGTCPHEYSYRASNNNESQPVLSGHRACLNLLTK